MKSGNNNDVSLLKQIFNEFLEMDDSKRKISEMISNNRKRLLLDLEEIKNFNKELAAKIINAPLNIINSLEECLGNSVRDNTDLSIDKSKNQSHHTVKYHIGFTGFLGKNFVTPRGIDVFLIHKLVRIQGIATRLSLVKPKIVKSIHYCENTNQFSIFEYSDQYSINNSDKSKKNVFLPTKDSAGNPLTTEFGLCNYKDYQTVLIQEMPEKIPHGQLPRSIEVILEEDLTDSVKPGDRVEITGVYKSIATKNSADAGIFRSLIIATNIRPMADYENVTLSEADIKNIKEIAKNKKLFHLLSNSFGSGLEGHKYVKQGLILQLLGGIEKNLETGTHLRGDINILLIGDPSTGKSQLLRQMLNTATLCLNTTGRGSTGVGLTAAVIIDKDSGERHLEAGAMVLADRGIVCIDEFDKMNDIDRVAIHEVMEQQTVTIAKAGMYTSLNARCSVLAAANPIYGEYIKEFNLNRNIGLPDSILSRFDLIFVILDEKVPEKDRKIAQRVTQNHYRFENKEAQIPVNDDADIYIEPEIRLMKKETQIFDKENCKRFGLENKELLSNEFLKKYLWYAHKTISPTLSNEASEILSNEWTRIRSNVADHATPITVRTLETLIRLATAHAKSRLSTIVEPKDCKVAINLINFSLFGKAPESEEDITKESKAKLDKKSKKKLEPSEDQKASKKKSLSKRKKEEKEQDVLGLMINAPISFEPISDEVKKEMYHLLIEEKKKENIETFKLDYIWEKISKIDPRKPSKLKFKTKDEMINVFRELQKNNQVFISEEDQSVTLI